MNPNQELNPDPNTQPGPTPQFQPSQPSPVPQAQPQQFGQQPTFNNSPAGPIMANQPTPQMQPFDYSGAQYGSPQKLKGFNKKILAIIVSLLILAVVGALSFIGIRQFSSGGIKLIEYTSNDLGYSIKIPEGWSTEEKNERFNRSTEITEPTADLDDKSTEAQYRASIEIEYELAESDYDKKSEQKFFNDIKEGIKAYIDDQDDKSSDSSSSYTDEKSTLINEKSTEVNGLKAYQIKLKVNNYNYKKDDVGYENLMAIYVNDEKQYLLSISWHESEKLDEISETILYSFVKK